MTRAITQTEGHKSSDKTQGFEVHIQWTVNLVYYIWPIHSSGHYVGMYVFLSPNNG